MEVSVLASGGPLCALSSKKVSRASLSAAEFTSSLGSGGTCASWDALHLSTASSHWAALCVLEISHRCPLNSSEVSKMPQQQSPVI